MLRWLTSTTNFRVTLPRRLPSSRRSLSRPLLLLRRLSRVTTSASADDIMLPVVSLPSVPRYDTNPMLLIYHALQAPHRLSSVFHMRQRCSCASAPFPLAPSSRRGVWMPPLPLLCMSRSTRVPSHHRLSFAPPPCGCRHCPSFACHVQRGYPATTASRSHLRLSHSIRVIRRLAAS